MIRALIGQIDSLDYGLLFFNVGGVVYEILISYKTYEALKNHQKAEETRIHIYHSITDRSQKLFGFHIEKDRELFKHLKSLNGIGEMTALRVLSYLDGEHLLEIVKNNDKALLEKIPKVKGKTSEKILFEIKQNYKKFESFVNESMQENKQPTQMDSAKQLAVMALVKLGFDEKTANSEVNRILKSNPDEKNPSIIIKQVLKVI